MATNFLGDDKVGTRWPSRYRTDVADCARCGIEIRKPKPGRPGICEDCRESDPEYVQMVRAKAKARRAA